MIEKNKQYTINTKIQSICSEADLGVFSMFGRKGAPTKRGPTKGQNFFLHFFATWYEQNVDDDLLCVSAPTLLGEGSRGGGRGLWGIHILGAPTFFLKGDPAWSKSGPGYARLSSSHSFMCKKGKVFPYSLPSVGLGADPGVQAVSPEVT